MWKRILLYGALGIAAVIGGGFAYLSLRSPNALPAESIKVPMTPEAIARGEYIFTVAAACDNCHSQHDFTRFGAPIVVSGRGRGWDFPKELGLPGAVTARNITPDVETGIGSWTDGEKIRAIREGVSRDGSALFPMMPYEYYRHMSDSDVQALVAYMNTLPPIRNPLPPTKLDFPVNYLIVSAPAPARNVPAVDTNGKLEWGRYLATLAHCGECHTPKEKGAPIAGLEFAGGEAFQIGEMKAVSANITPNMDTGIGKVSEQEFIEKFHQHRKYAETGPPPAKPENFTVMAWLALSKMSREELSAIYGYLRTVKPVDHSVETHPVK